MKRIIPWLVGVITSLLAIGLFWLPGTAQAADGPVHLKSDCAGVTAWYVNGDEDGSDTKQGDRRPTVTANGLVFEKNQLIHHETQIDVDTLEPGSFTASPKPSLATFFSVEVLNLDTKKGYGTLRYDPSHFGEKGAWNIGGTDFWDADPGQLVADHNKGTTVISFGVGYVNTPNDGIKTTVTGISFNGTKYDLTCKPKPSSSSPSTKPTSSKPTRSSSAPAGGPAPTGGSSGSNGALAITGPSAPKVAIVAGLILAVGVGALVATRRRRTKFES